MHATLLTPSLEASESRNVVPFVRKSGLKVAFFCDRFPVVSEAFIASSAAALIDQGHDVHIYALNGVSADETDLQPHVASHDLMARLRYPLVTHGFAARLAGALPELASLVNQRKRRSVNAFNPVIFRRSAVNLRALYLASMLGPAADYDILHCQFGHLAHDVLRLRRAGFLNGRAIVQFRGYDITQIPNEAGPGFYDEVFWHADHFIANSDFIAERAAVLGAPRTRMSVSYSGIDLSNFPFRAPVTWSPGEPLRLMTVGRLVEKKGIAFALDAAARLKAAGTPVHYDIVGEGPDRDPLRAIARRLGLERDVTFHGGRGHAFIRPLLEQAHLFLAPSVTAANTNADAPVNTLKEAMATGVPVVSTWHGGIPELVDDGVNGFLAQEGNGEALWRRIEDALGLRAQWPQIAEAARTKVASQFGLDRTTRSLLDVYQQVLGS